MDFLQLHSLNRWAVVFLVVLVVVRSAMGLAMKKKWEAIDDKLSLFALIATHLQFVLGLLIYFIGDKGIKAFLVNGSSVMANSEARLWAVEHGFVAIIGIALITIGRVKGKKAPTDAGKFKTHLIFFLLGILAILSRIPLDRWS